jgi:hypothetical protein
MDQFHWYNLFHWSYVGKEAIDAQQKLQAEAKSRRAFAKKQCVEYYLKATGEWYNDAHIILCTLMIDWSWRDLNHEIEIVL